MGLVLPPGANAPCDFNIDGGRVWINGVEVGWVKSIDFSHEMTVGQTEIQVVFQPTSITYGHPPTDVVNHLHDQALSDPGDTVDISKAIERAKHRKGEHP